MSGPAEQPPLRFATLHERIREGVEQVARAEAAPGDPLGGLYLTDGQALSLIADGPPSSVDERVAAAARLLGLDGLEQTVLAVCAAPELSWRYARLYGYLHDDMTRQLASPRLAAALLAGGRVAGGEVLERLGEDAGLRRSGAISLLDEPRLALADRPLKCADRLAALLIGGLAEDWPPDCEPVPVPALAAAGEAALAELRATIETAGELPVAVVGDDAPSALASALQAPVLLASVAGLEEPGRLPGLRLAAALAQRTLAFDGLERATASQRETIWQTLRRRSGGERTLVCVGAREEGAVLAHAPALVVRTGALGLPERRAAWSTLIGADMLEDAAGAVEDVSVKFRLSLSQIARAAELARARPRARGDTAVTAEDLDRGARDASRHGLAALALRVEGEHGWDSLVVPQRSLRSLRMIAAFLRHRDRVLLDWGAGAPRAASGLTALFAGESGTGKTLAAQVVAGELGLELFRVDLATVVSKYVGETEKNLDRIFGAAEGSNAMLLFDEADALFGKRSEVRDAHDRYANVEVAYLLQRIEGYAGAVILTTNLRQNVDEGFLRRLDLVVDFPFPQAGDREELWRRLLPAHAPLERLDIPFLASRFKLAGGSIRNAALTATLLAADERSPITMELLVRAVALEYEKLGRLTLEADFERFHDVAHDSQLGVG
jgi:ATPase family associated with various cellular activities (AAA)/Winged helix domain, variant